MRLELLPRKEFEFTLDSGQKVLGRYNTWAIKRFCDKKKISLSQLISLLREETLTLDYIVEMILCSIEYVVRRNKEPFTYTDLDVCDWIDEMGGMGSEMYLSLINHLGSDQEEEKKSLTENLNGQDYSESPTSPA
jgi:hypothetical protein